jgi:hypothetical protein
MLLIQKRSKGQINITGTYGEKQFIKILLLSPFYSPKYKISRASSFFHLCATWLLFPTEENRLQAYENNVQLHINMSRRGSSLKLEYAEHMTRYGETIISFRLRANRDVFMYVIWYTLPAIC